VITGAAKGIGRATAELFASEGARIVAGDIDNGTRAIDWAADRSRRCSALNSSRLGDSG
jgi:NAD(P)-dependent dehydrogenase (short-subunit alcohol dehydrogenase family)